MKSISPLLLLLACASASLAQLSGPLSGTLGPGEFHVVDTISVEAGDSLTLLPGTTFTFDGPYPFYIFGTLSAEGTENDSIYFTTNLVDSRRRWQGLRFYNDGGSRSILAYCVIQNVARLTLSGGGVDCYESSPSFSNCTIRGNRSRSGGGVYCWDTSSPAFRECTFVGNSASQFGGGVYCASNSSPHFVECIFEANRALSYGGGVYCQNRSSPTFTNCSISHNEAGTSSGEGGGGVFCESSFAVFSGCMLSGNSALGAASYGGGVYCHDSSPTFMNCTLSDNLATSGVWYGGGGGVFCGNHSSPTFAHCTLSGNVAARDGGGVYCEESSPNFSDCTLNANSAYYSGGGLSCQNNSSPDLTNCTLQNNSIQIFGGGVYCGNDCSPEFAFCTISDNWANDGGGVHCGMNSSPVFTKCTISGNASNYCAGVYLTESSAILNSTIIAFCEGSGISFFQSSESRVAYCDIFGNNGGDIAFYRNDPSHGPPAIGMPAHINPNGDRCDSYYNICLNPMFVDTAAGDFHLPAGSPCIDAGDPLALPDSDATVADIGVFYFPQEPPNFALSPDSLNFGSLPYRGDSTLSFWIRNPTSETLHAAGIWATNASIFHVNPSWAHIFPFDSVEVEVTFTPLRNRTYLDSVYVTFMGLDEIETVILKGTGFFDCHVLAGGVIGGTLSANCSPYYVLDDLILEESDTLEIEPGVELVFDVPCRLEVHGLLLAEGTPQDSIVFTCDTRFNPDRWRGIRFYDADDSSRLECCVVEYAKAEGYWPDGWGGGVYCTHSSPVITHCTFRYNSANQYGGGLGCYESSPIIRDCFFMNNSASLAGGGIYCDVSSGSFTNCIFRYNTATYSGGGFCCRHSSSSLYDCTMLNNSARNGGGAMFYYESTLSLTNCSFHDNTADGNGGGAYCEDSSPVFMNCTISSNEVDRTSSYDGNGGGLYCEDSAPSFMNCTIDNNTAFRNGGGLCFRHSSPVVTNCTIRRNSSLYYSGGGVYCYSSSPMIMSCAICDNSAEGGGGLWCERSSSKLTNCLLIGNSAGAGGGLYCLSSSDTLMNCALAMNSASYRTGGGAYLVGSSIILKNAIFAFSQFEGIRFRDSESSRVEYCDFFGSIVEPFSFDGWDPSNGPQNIGEISVTNSNGDPCDPYRNIFLDPMFMDTTLHDFHLLPSSPCVAAADPTGSPPTDIEGNPRPSPAGTLPDIGAYESGSGGHPWAFNLISPQEGDTCWTPDTTFVWHAPFNPETNDTIRYEVWVDTTSYFTTAWEVAAGLVDTFSHISGLSDDHAFYWTVHASDLNSEGIWAESPLMFHTYFPEYPSGFALLSPEDGSQLSPGEVNFCWQAAHDPDPNDIVVYTLHFAAGNTSFAYPASSDSCWMFDVCILGAKDSSLVEWWVEAHSTYPDIAIESGSRYSFHAPRRIPVTFALHQNYPNPFNSSTVIRYDVPQAGIVSLTVFNLLGQKVATLFDGRQLAGSYTISWDAANLPSGVYLCRMETAGFAQTRKMLLVK